MLPGGTSSYSLRRGSLMKPGSRQVAQMSFLGVGAPEAILVGVVALVVFGPKGLADAAKSVGQTLRAFQPTIREVVDVSRDLKGTLEKELGLDELREAARPAPINRPSTEMPTELDPDIEAKRAESAKMAWGLQQQAAAMTSAASADEAAAAAPAKTTSTQDLGSMSMADLEAELARRKAAADGAKAQ